MKKATLFFLMLALIATSSIAQTTMMYFKMEVDVPTYPDYKTRLKKGGSIHIDLGNDSTSVLYKDVALNNQ